MIAIPEHNFLGINTIIQKINQIWFPKVSGVEGFGKALAKTLSGFSEH
jgi:hypothetical protein